MLLDNKEDIDDIIDKGLWKRGQDDYIAFKDMDADYLQKVFYTLQQREKRFRNSYNINLDITSRLYQKAIERSNELGVELKCEFIPMQNLPPEPQFEGTSEWFLNLINKDSTTDK